MVARWIWAAVPLTPLVITLPLTDLPAPTVIVPVPVAPVVTGGISWLPLSATFVPPLEDMLAHPASRIATAPMLAHRKPLTTCRSPLIRLPPSSRVTDTDRIGRLHSTLTEHPSTLDQGPVFSGTGGRRTLSCKPRSATMASLTEAPRPKAVLVSVQLQGVTDAEQQSSLKELKRLCETLGFEVVGEVTQKRQGLGAATLLGEGKLVELAAWTGGTGVVPKGPPGKKKATEEDQEEEEAPAGPTRG